MASSNPLSVPSWLLNAPPEILLHILSFLDISDLASIAQADPRLATLAFDPLLQRTRLLVVAPSRVSHALFAAGPQGAPLRPSVSDLVHRNVMRGIGLDRIARIGGYIYSPLAARNYENARRLQRHHTADILTFAMRSRPQGSELLRSLHAIRVLPDVESSQPSVARALLPAVRQLKWSLHRDGIARVLRARSLVPHKGEYDGDYDTTVSPAIARGLLPAIKKLQWSLRRDRLAKMVRHRHDGERSVANWIVNRGTIVSENERVRLAICPGVKNIVSRYEHMSIKSSTVYDAARITAT